MYIKYSGCTADQIIEAFDELANAVIHKHNELPGPVLGDMRNTTSSQLVTNKGRELVRRTRGLPELPTAIVGFGGVQKTVGQMFASFRKGHTLYFADSYEDAQNWLVNRDKKYARQPLNLNRQPLKQPLPASVVCYPSNPPLNATPAAQPHPDPNLADSLHFLRKEAIAWEEAGAVTGNCLEIKATFLVDSSSTVSLTLRDDARDHPLTVDFAHSDLHVLNEKPNLKQFNSSEPLNITLPIWGPCGYSARKWSKVFLCVRKGAFLFFGVFWQFLRWIWRL